MYTLTVKITKELIEKSSMCGFRPDGTKDDMATGYIAESCLFALAFRDIFPNAWVDEEYTFPFGIASDEEDSIKNPIEVVALIQEFDKMTPAQRIDTIQEQEFNISIPDIVVEKIDISSLLYLLKDHKNLKLQEV